jgi:hypothetical protein
MSLDITVNVSAINIDEFGIDRQSSDAAHVSYGNGQIS